MKRTMPISTRFQSTHPRAGEPTYFMEKIKTSIGVLDAADGYEPKHHTIRAGKRWNVGDMIDFFIWSGLPYRSKWIRPLPLIEVKKVFDIDIDENGIIAVNGKYLIEDESNEEESAEYRLAINDGLEPSDFHHWLIAPVYKAAKPFDGQIICWNENINY